MDSTKLKIDITVCLYVIPFVCVSYLAVIGCLKWRQAVSEVSSQKSEIASYGVGMHLVRWNGEACYWRTM